MDNLSPRNTKNEILKAYSDLLTKYETEAANVTNKKVITQAKENKDAENKAVIKAQLLAKEMEGNTKLAKLKISSLEDIIAKQNTQIQELSNQLNAANNQVQNIAIRVIGSVSDAKALNKVNEIALEQAKSISAQV